MAKQQSLKETNPQQYYKKRKRWLSVGKFACTFVPAITVLIIYALGSCFNWKWTNPLNPFKFTLGIIIMIVGIVIFVGHELRAISKENKRVNEGADFTQSVIWLYLAVVLWLFALTMVYLIIFCAVEFVGSFFGAFCTASIKECNALMEKEETAEINAKAIVRAQEEAKRKISNSTPVE